MNSEESGGYLKGFGVFRSVKGQKDSQQESFLSFAPLMFSVNKFH